MTPPKSVPPAESGEDSLPASQPRHSLATGTPSAVGTAPEPEAVADSVSARFLASRSKAMRPVLDLARKVAATRSSVLIFGESGTGKEMIARVLGTPARGQPKAAEQPQVSCGKADFLL